MNIKSFEKKLIDCDVSDKDVVKALSISKSAYYRKKNGQSEFTRSEINACIDFLKLTPDETMDIFFKV